MASTQIPKTVKQWNVATLTGFGGLKFSEQPLPEIGDSQVLVKLEAASLNYRDLIIALGQYPFGVAENVIPGSDGAGTVVAVGKQVTLFKPGDKVVTLFNQGHLGGDLTPQTIATGTGGVLDGVLRTYGAFNENALVRSPSNLTPAEASTLSCAGLTAWNALFGSIDHTLKAGQWVLVQGTGGVSIFALQFAKAAGAKVIATTGSPDKVQTLKKLGADHVLNYKEDPNWGETAKKLTGGRGVDHVVQVAGAKEMQQSIAAVKMAGVIDIIGFLAGTSEEKEPSFLSCLGSLFTARGILVGNRVQMEEMIQAIEAHPEALKPVVDEKVFKLEQLKEAYEYQWSGKHFAKVVVEIN
ncbi:alcohol dehydrogenase [Trichoderma arundinaceum]|uniref:Alcohol dehydrogenase n=1 Tax=Trichoderma arundinaceum TaxID=490622 RepID=A0A395NGD4_TRIAR|nr:alcohol dehydrogenase [Trichoderma arundinaceum]